MTAASETPEAIVARFRPLFEPKRVAVVGASTSGSSAGNRFIRNVRAAGYEGELYPIHPKAETVEGYRAYTSFADLPGPVDYVFIAVRPNRVLDVIEDASGRVRFAQIMTSGFGEVPGGESLQERIVESAHAGGIRLLGPNCIGTHSPRGGLTFTDVADNEPGPVGVLSQSGGLAIDILRRGRNRGLSFSAIVSMGNCADLGPNDLLSYFLADAETRVIGMYIEHVRDGRRFFDQLRRAGARKPIVLLKGGRTRLGARAAASHTGSLADDDQAWRALARQTGSILVDDLEEFLDILTVFQDYRPRSGPPSNRTALFGNGGGTSVLAADHCARQGLDIPPLSAGTREALSSLEESTGASLENPIDTPANLLQRDEGRMAERILDALLEHETLGGLIIHLNVAVLLGYRDVPMLDTLTRAVHRAIERYPGRAHLVLALRSDGDENVEAEKRRHRRAATQAGVPVFDEPRNAARALAAVHGFESFHHRRAEPDTR